MMGVDAMVVVWCDSGVVGCGCNGDGGVMECGYNGVVRCGGVWCDGGGGVLWCGVDAIVMARCGVVWIQ